MIHLGINLGIIVAGLLVLRWTFRKHFTFYGPDDIMPGETRKRTTNPKKAQI